MKTAIFLWLCSVMSALSFSGTIIAPVVVQVVDEHGEAVVGAKVQIKGSRLDDIPKNELDPNSKFAKLALKAAGIRTTDDLGMALVYCGGGYIPDEDAGGILVGLGGTVVVTAKGYLNAEVRFDRSFASKKSGITQLSLKVTVILKTAERRR